MADSIKHDVISWLNRVVIGLNLCPFSAQPVHNKQVRFQVSEAKDEESVLADLALEMEFLDRTPVTEIETTLLIIPYALQDFHDYNQCVIWAQSRLKKQGWQGVYQLASFHPHYCFAGADPDDDENLTNRAPYPIIHIIREASLEKALHYFKDVEGIPVRNKVCVENLSTEQKQRLFPYLFADNSGE